MSYWTSDIIAFHERFGLKPTGTVPHLLEGDLRSFRLKFLKEELDELELAYAESNLPEAFDAIIDLIYVALGTAYLMRLPINQGWYEVHQANMRKIRAMNPEQSKRGSQYDIIKPEGWKAPDLISILSQHGWKPW